MPAHPDSTPRPLEGYRHLVFAILGLGLPVALWLIGGSDIRDRQGLDARGIVTQGRVVDHSTHHSSGNCSRAAWIEYAVGRTVHRIRATGCGAGAERLPKGRAVDVTYDPLRPEVAQVRLVDAAVPRMSYGAALLPLGLAALFLWLAWRERPSRRGHPRRS